MPSKTEVKHMKAGCALDQLMAELMGYVRVTNDADREDNPITFMVYDDGESGERVLRGTPYEIEPGYYGFSFEVWSPSTDIRAAWEVVEMFRKSKGAHWDISAGAHGWCVVIVWEGEGDPVSTWADWADGAQLAICKAMSEAAG